MTDEEFTGRYHDAWLSKRLILPLRHIKEESKLILHCRRLPYPERLTISIYVNGNLIHEERDPEGQFTITTCIPPMIRGDLEIVASDVFVPKEKGMNEDVRKLSFLLDEMIVPGQPDLMEPYLHLFDFQPSRKVYFLEDEVWDLLSFLLSNNYKIPFKDMIRPLKEQGWWEKLQPPASSFIRGTVYDKFSGVALQKAAVQLLNRQGDCLMETQANDQGMYDFHELESGDYVVSGRSGEYGSQDIKVRLGVYGKTIHIPMLPLG